MALRHNHYDAAFEEFLRAQRTAHVVVDEKRRALIQQASLKSLDFIVYSSRGSNLLVDVKGRRFPSGGAHGSHKWENWATEDDLRCMLHWQRMFGGGFRSLLVFAYEIVEPKYREELTAPFAFRDRTYAFYGVWAEQYSQLMRTRSTSWETVALPSDEYRKLRAPIAEYL